MPGKKVDLHLSKSKTIKELNEQVAAAVGGNTNSNPKLLLKSLDKLYEAGQKSQIDGDEEKAYVFFMRFLEIYTRVKKSDDFKQDPNYFSKMIGSKKVTDCLTMSEKLADSLNQRYELVKQAEKIDSKLKNDEMKDAEENEKKRLAKSSAPTVNGIDKSSKINVKEKPNESTGVMTVSKLKTLMEQKSTRLLTIDCRAKDDFTRAHLNHSNCICIPSELLQPGFSANKIETELKKHYPESYLDWKKREDFDRVILYDWNSSFENQQCSIEVLYNAMTTWDPETKYKVPPCILQGGVRNLYYTYPTLINRPQNMREEDSKKVESSKNLDTISYPNLDDDRNSRGKSESPAGKITNNFSNLDLNSKTSSVNNNSVPKLGTTSHPVTFDRSVKPKIIPNNISNGPVNNHHDGERHSNKVSEFPKDLVNGNAFASKSQTNGFNREVLSSALDDLLRSSNEVSNHEKVLTELHDKSLNSAANEELTKKLKEKQQEVEELKKLVSNKEENFISLQKDYKLLVERERSKSSLPYIRPSKEDSEIEEKLMQKKALDDYVTQLREDRKKKEKDRTSVVPKGNTTLPAINSPQLTSRPRVSSSCTTPLPTINSVIDANKSIVPGQSHSTTKPTSTGGSLLRPMSQDASPISFQKLKDETHAESPRSSHLKRSHSHPNIAQSLNEEDMSPDHTISSQTPNFNRNLKPPSGRSHAPDTFTPGRREFHAVNSTAKLRTGLKNLGNTCYMNSIMQCLNHLAGLVDFFVGRECSDLIAKHLSDTKGEIACEFAAAIKEMNYGHRSIALNNLKSIVGKYNSTFRGTDQQDSHEFLTILLAWLHEELNTVPTKTKPKEQKNDGLSDKEASMKAWQDYCASSYSKILELFCGQQKSCIKCQNCGKESVTYEAFFVLSVPLPPDKNKISLNECIDFYTKEELLSDRNCENCNKKGKTTKKIDLWRLPPYLIVHFQRFYSDGWWKKRITEVEFPNDNLDLSSRVKGKISQDVRAHRYNFQLQGVSNHYGAIDNGHYTAYCRSNKGGETCWWKFDDHEVTQIDPRNVCSSAAYILFYCNTSP